MLFRDIISESMAYNLWVQIIMGPSIEIFWYIFYCNNATPTFLCPLCFVLSVSSGWRKFSNISVSSVGSWGFQLLKAEGILLTPAPFTVSTNILCPDDLIQFNSFKYHVSVESPNLLLWPLLLTEIQTSISIV